MDGLLFSSDLGNDRPYDGNYDLLLATEDTTFLMITNSTLFPADVDVANLRRCTGGNAIHFQLNGEAGRCNPMLCQPIYGYPTGRVASWL